MKRRYKSGIRSLEDRGGHDHSWSPFPFGVQCIIGIMIVIIMIANCKG